MNLKRPFWIFILCLSFFQLGQFMLAQENSTIPSYSFEKFQLPDGIRSNSVQSIIQDNYGYMWYASKNGLHRWDGYQFKTYRHDPEDSTSIGGNYEVGSRVPEEIGECAYIRDSQHVAP